MNFSQDTVAPRRKVIYVVSDDLAKVSSLLPSNRNRSIVVHSLISSLGLLSSPLDSQQLHVLKPTVASVKELLGYHSRDYLDFILNVATESSLETGSRSVDSEFGLEDDCPPFPGLSKYVQLVAGASLTAAKALHAGEADVAISWDGGRHHAQKSRASGFCYVADCVLSIMSLKRNLPPPLAALPPTTEGRTERKPRVMYLDLDLHFSDAVSQAFSTPASSTCPQVLTFSIHHSSPGFFPISPLSSLPTPSHLSFDPFTLSLPLQRGASNSTFARIWPIVERVKTLFAPDYVVLQCGVDGLAGDPCRVWNWGLGDSEGSFGWCVARVIENWHCRTLLLGGGGYSSPNAARAWAYLTSIALSRLLPLETDIPDHRVFPLYAPSFTLDVPPGNMPDENDDAYLSAVETCFAEVLKVLEDRCLE